MTRDEKHIGLPLTRERFERLYAARSGIAVDELHAMGRFAEPCDCGDSRCQGWAMGHQWEDAIVEDRVREEA